MSWEESLTPPERRDWERFVSHVREEAVQAMDESAFVMQLMPEGEADIKFAVELGLSLMMDKPIMVVVRPGVYVPDKLLGVADLVVRADVDTEEGRREVTSAIEKMRQMVDEREGGT